MDTISMVFVGGLYFVFVLTCIIVLIFKVIERIKEKPKDDNDLNKFDKY